jgi:hypothetical protein
MNWPPPSAPALAAVLFHNGLTSLVLRGHHGEPAAAAVCRLCALPCHTRGCSGRQPVIVRTHAGKPPSLFDRDRRFTALLVNDTDGRSLGDDGSRSMGAAALAYKIEDESSSPSLRGIPATSLPHARCC